jgi:SPX domain protein involved in polyphosphate accumulation
LDEDKNDISFDPSEEFSFSTSSSLDIEDSTCLMTKRQREPNVSLVECLDDLSDEDSSDNASCATNHFSHLEQLEEINQVLMEEFHKLVGKHKKLQEKHSNILCSHEKLIDSYALLETNHEVLVTAVKLYQHHTCTYAPHSIDLSCANSCYSQANPLCDEHVLIRNL